MRPSSSPGRTASLLTTCALTLLLPACRGSEPDLSPIDQVRNPIGTSAFRYTRQNAAAAIHAILGRYERVHLLTRVADLALTDPTLARAIVFVAMSAHPIDGPPALAAREASLYRFDVTFVLEGQEWLVATASWRRAQATDFSL